MSEVPPPSIEDVIRIKRRPYTNISEQRDIAEEFKQYYIRERKSGRVDAKQIFRDFRKDKELDNIWFNPYPNMVTSMLARCEKELPMTMRTIKFKTFRKPKHPPKNEIIEDIVSKPVEYHELEDGAKNLQDLLIQDAQKLIQQSNEEYQMIDEQGGMWKAKDWHDIQLKKKSLALAVAKEVLAGVQKHELVKIKRNKEGRETAGFLMDLMQKSTAGDLSEEDLRLLDTATQ